jgi:outer membrane protein insertion porin family
MKAASGLLSAVSAAALSTALVASGVAVVQFAAVNAASAAVVRSIDVQGNQRVEASIIRDYVGIDPGQNFSNADLDEATKRLFATGLFSDVSINQAGSSLIVRVQEYQIVNQVLFQGNDKIKDANLATAVQLKPRGTFSQSTLDADVEAVRQAYRQIGRDDATVSGRTIDLGENRVNVVFEINEGDRTKITEINFIGNNAYGDRRLRDLISTKRSNFLSFLFRDDVYDEQRLRADEETLRRFYYNHGYADFQVVSSSADLDANSNSYVVNITVDEGERYTFGNIGIESTIEGVDGESFRSAIKTNEGETYSAEDVEDSIIAITERLAGIGYAFAQVTPRGDRNVENHTISVVYALDQGPRTYVERIEIRGNDRTRDYVIRREFDVSEGDAFNQVLIQRAKKRLEALGYFQTVNVSTAPGSEPDQVVLLVEVVEKSTGSFNVGAGYTTGGDAAGPSVEGGISESNFLGRGQYISVSAGGGENARDYRFSFTEPYFLGRRVAAGFDIYHSTRDYDNYDSEATGGTIRLGLPITDDLSAQVAYNYLQEEYDLEDDDDDVSRAIRNAVEESPWIKSSVSTSLIYNTIDDMKNPHSGLYLVGTVEAAGLGGDAEWVKFTTRNTYYQTLSEEYDVVGILTAGAGYITSYGDNDLRVFDHFRNTDRIIRGFKYGQIGPADRQKDGDYDYLGGTTYFSASAETQFPLPFVPESLGLKGAAFVDAATLYGNDLDEADTSVDSSWRAAAGIGLVWASPFGPLRVDYTVPLAKEDSDEEQNFNFGVSTRF